MGVIAKPEAAQHGKMIRQVSRFKEDHHLQSAFVTLGSRSSTGVIYLYSASLGIFQIFKTAVTQHALSQFFFKKMFSLIFHFMRDVHTQFTTFRK